MGYGLFDLKNSVTKTTSAFFEPALDYVVVKIPRWDLTKFHGVKRELGSAMKSVGEVMAVGRTFEEALQKGLRMIGQGMHGFVENHEIKIQDIAKSLHEPTDMRIFVVSKALKIGYTVDQIHALTKIDRWFLEKLKHIVDIDEQLKAYSHLAEVSEFMEASEFMEYLSSPEIYQLLRAAKVYGFSDFQIARAIGLEYRMKMEQAGLTVRKWRKELGIVPTVNQIDTLAAEYPAQTKAILNVQEQTQALRDKALKMSQKIRHRGPDWSGIYCGGSAILAHERLSIVDPESGGQPLFSPDRKQVLAVNGEIYNHQEIRRRYAGQYEFQTGSDCEVILALYREKNINFLEDLSGIFAFVLYDEETDEFLIARDPIGVIPLYIGYDSDGTVYVASELKALEGQCERYEPFLPGHYYWSKEPGMKRYYQRDWFDYEAVKNNDASVDAIHDALTDAVKRQLMSDVPYGVLLSGGLDSSVISAIAEKFSEHRIEDDSKTKAYWPRLHSFAVGLKGAPDLAKAKLVADHIGTVHHEMTLSTTSRPTTSLPSVLLRRCTCWLVSSSRWVSRWCSLAKVLTRYSVVTSISIRLLQQKISTKRRCANLASSTYTTACVPTRVCRHGA